jgi:nucleotide-binding universal stress UspA family protein
MQQLTSIVVGIDFTAGAAAALREAIRIAAWNRSRLSVVHVIDTLVVMDLEAALSEFQISLREELIAQARGEWARFAAGIEGAASLELQIRINNRTVGIIGAARDAQADLLVVGAYGTHAPETGIGSIAGGCVRHAPCDVLLVRDHQAGPFRSIVACVDFSPTSLSALDRASRIAAQDGASLHILHVFDAPWHQLNYRGGPPGTGPSYETAHRDAVLARLGNFSQSLGHEITYLKPTICLHDHRGHRSGIVDYAAKVNADLIVMGTRGGTNVRDVLLGTTAEKTLRQSTCSVLAVKPGHPVPHLIEHEPEARPNPQTRPPE